MGFIKWFNDLFSEKKENNVELPKWVGKEWTWKSQTIYQNDMLAKLFLDKWHINTPLKMFMFILIIDVIYIYVLTYLKGYLLPRPGLISVLEDWPSQVDGLLIVPIALSFYVLQLKETQHLFAYFARNGLVQATEREYDDFVEYVVQVFNWKGWQLISLVVLFITYLPWLFEFTSEPSSYWYNQVILYITPYNLLQWYLAWSIIWRFIVTIYMLNLFFKRFNLVLSLYDPQHSAGFNIIGRYSAQVATFSTVLMLHLLILSQPIWKLDLPPTLNSIVSMWIIYLLVAPFVIGLPLYITHRGLKREKKILADMFRKKSQLLMRQFLLNDLPKKDSKIAEELVKAWEVGKAIDSISVWSINWPLIPRLLVTVLIPIVFSALLEIGLEKSLEPYFSNFVNLFK